MKSISTLIMAAVFGLGLSACEDHLTYDPQGTVGGEELNTADNVEGMVTAAYAALGNDHWTTPFTTLWPYGNVRADDAYKGGGGTGDVFEYNSLEQFVFTQPTFGPVDDLWFRLYVGISRANQALQRLEEISPDELPDHTARQAEMRFIRGHFHFILTILFNRVPYIDETVAEGEHQTISNVALSNEELWERIAADFRFAMENLPDSQAQRGRVNRYAAAAYLAKVQLYRAYQKNDAYQVTGIDQALLQEVVELTDLVADGGYALNADFAENFLWETEANPEVVFAIMMSVDDGTPNGRLDMGNGLNYHMGPGYGCCWFHIPSQNLINAFKTSDGLPQFDRYNGTSLADSTDYWTNTVDPRIDHTVGIVGHPFKYDPSYIFEPGWARTPQVYGHHSSMKELQHPNSPSLRAVGPFWASSKDVVVIRYADVLLWKAEALIELGRHAEALPIINRIRERAATSTDRLKFADGTPISNYDVRPYPAAGWTQSFARQALRWERRLELALEGSRFFDLVRWGVAEETLNEYFDVEKTRREFLREARFTAGRDEYLPIPQQQIDFSQDLYEQNPGY